MSGHQTPEEVRQVFIKSMGEKLGSSFYVLWQELSWLYTKWGEYVELYGAKPSRIDLLNKAAPRFFRIVQDVLWDEMILHIARLTDPPQSKGKANLTIRRLSPLVEDEDFKKALDPLIEVAIQKTDFCRDWRNRRIAHLDLEHTINKEINPLKPASRKYVKEALDSIGEVLNAVTEHYADSSTIFDIEEGSGGAVSLLYIIDDGLKAEEERRDRIRRGNFIKGDLSPRDL
jgi:hypothetical protein